MFVFRSGKGEPMSKVLTTNVEVLSVTSASQRFAAVLIHGGEYYLTCTKACWIKVTTTSGTASAATGSVYVPADTFVPVTRGSATDCKVAIIRAAEDGTACLNLVTVGG